MEVAMKIQGLVNGGRTGFDGEYLVEYDPERDGFDPLLDLPMDAFVSTTPVLAEAKRFETLVEFQAEWARVCQREPTRADGKPNRPLTAFTVSTVPIPEKEE